MENIRITLKKIEKISKNEREGMKYDGRTRPGYKYRNSALSLSCY